MRLFDCKKNKGNNKHLADKDESERKKIILEKLNEAYKKITLNNQEDLAVELKNIIDMFNSSTESKCFGTNAANGLLLGCADKLLYFANENDYCGISMYLDSLSRLISDQTYFTLYDLNDTRYIHCQIEILNLGIEKKRMELDIEKLRTRFFEIYSKEIKLSIEEEVFSIENLQDIKNSMEFLFKLISNLSNITLYALDDIHSIHYQIEHLNLEIENKESVPNIEKIKIQLFEIYENAIKLLFDEQDFSIEDLQGIKDSIEKLNKKIIDVDWKIKRFRDIILQIEENLGVEINKLTDEVTVVSKTCKHDKKIKISTSSIDGIPLDLELESLIRDLQKRKYRLGILLDGLRNREYSRNNCNIEVQRQKSDSSFIISCEEVDTETLHAFLETDDENTNSSSSSDDFLDIQKDSFGDTQTSKIQKESDSKTIDKAEFAVVFPKEIEKGDTFQMDFSMYVKEECEAVLEDIKSNHDYDTQVTKTGYKSIERNTEITVKLTSRDLPDLADEVSFTWEGESAREQFMVDIPSDFEKNKILFNFDIYGNCFKISTIRVLIPFEKKKEDYEISRSDVRKAFISYSSADRYDVATLVQGMHTISPNTEIFFDVESLRQGENWEATIPRVIDESNVLYLCWSHNAYQSEWVKKEYKYGILKHGTEFIEPLPLEIPKEEYPVPKELSGKHFNDIYLLIRNVYKK